VSLAVMFPIYINTCWHPAGGPEADQSQGRRGSQQPYVRPRDRVPGALPLIKLPMHDDFSAWYAKRRTRGVSSGWNIHQGSFRPPHCN